MSIKLLPIMCLPFQYLSPILTHLSDLEIRLCIIHQVLVMHLQMDDNQMKRVHIILTEASSLIHLIFFYVDNNIFLCFSELKVRHLVPLAFSTYYVLPPRNMSVITTASPFSFNAALVPSVTWSVLWLILRTSSE